MNFETIGRPLELEGSTPQITDPFVVILPQFTPIFTPCLSDINLDFVFSSISQCLEVVSLHPCLSHSNHILVLQLPLRCHGIFCVFIFTWTYRPLPKVVFEVKL